MLPNTTGLHRLKQGIQITLIMEEYSGAERFPSLQAIHFPSMTPTEISQPEWHQTSPGVVAAPSHTKGSPGPVCCCLEAHGEHRAGQRDVPQCVLPVPSSLQLTDFLSMKEDLRSLTALDGVFIHQFVFPISGTPAYCISSKFHRLASVFKILLFASKLQFHLFSPSSIVKDHEQKLSCSFLLSSSCLHTTLFIFPFF